MIAHPESLREQFDQARLGLEVVDGSGQVTVTADGVAYDVLSKGEPKGLGLTEVIIDKRSLPAVVGRVVLLNNSEVGAFSPAVVTCPDPTLPNIAQITMLSREIFVPTRGITPGQQFGVSAKSQTRVSGFGSDNSSIAEEPGHFGVLMVGASNRRIASALAAEGDKVTHSVLDNPKGGLPETMDAQGLIDLGTKTALVDFSDPRVRVQAFWHPDTMQTADGVPLKADYPNSVEVLLGAGIKAVGARGVEAARGLVQHLTRQRSR
jgi:hypothetical protein